MTAESVPVPRDALIHLEVADDVAACERGGRDWTGSGDFYLTRSDSPRARFINCPDCLRTSASIYADRPDCRAEWKP